MAVNNIPELDTAGLRQFAITTGGVIAVLFGIGFPWLFDRALPVWPWFIFAGLTAWGLVAADSLRPVYIGWMKFALVLSRVTTPLVLGVVFVVVFVPVSLIFRMLGKDPMRRKETKLADSYKIQSEKPIEGNLKRPF